MTASPFVRSAGLLLPLASTPSRHGVGGLGPGASRVLEWCQAAGFGWWQMLPVGPLGPGDSPYASSSAFAGEPLYLSLEALVEDGLLPSSALKAPAALGRGPANYGRARAFKLPRLRRAYESWAQRRRSRRAFERFCAEQAAWLDPWASHVGGDETETRFLQFTFDEQWKTLRDEARTRGVRLMGDAPIFVGADSADVAAHPELFRLDRRGRPRVLTGVPPDAYAADGQLWGHPHYAWKAHERDGFAWWRRRLARQLRLFDAVRIDHFIGFHKAWEVTAGEPTARNGHWGRTPGRALLAAIRDELGGLPLVAEDLGAVGDGVFALRDEFGLPGMRVLQWGFEPGSYHAPENCLENTVVYPGTHDSPTAAGWWRQLDGPTRKRFRARTGSDARAVAWSLWRTAASTASHTAIVQLQDLLGLTNTARTNVPGTARGNWVWRASKNDFSRPLARRSRELADATDRLR